MKLKKKHIDGESVLPVMKTGFTVPEGYFESFGDRLKLRLEEEKVINLPARHRLVTYLRPLAGIAAVVAVILSVYLIQPGKTPIPVSSLNNLADYKGSDQSDSQFSAIESVLLDGQFISDLTDMDEFDASKMPKEALTDYLASNCNELEILDSSK